MGCLPGTTDMAPENWWSEGEISFWGYHLEDLAALVSGRVGGLLNLSVSFCRC